MAAVTTPRMDDRYALGVEFFRDRSRLRRRASIVAAGLLDGWLTGHLVHYGPIEDAQDAVLQLHGAHTMAAAPPAQRIEVIGLDEEGMAPDRPTYLDEYEQEPPTRRRVITTAIDRRGPANTLIRPLEKAHIEVIAANSGDLAEAHGLYLDALANHRLRIVPDDRLDAAMRHGEQRRAGDATAWSMRGSDVDTAPAKALELAVWAWLTMPRPPRSQHLLTDRGERRCCTSRSPTYLGKPDIPPG